jgi:cation:H+ antiporter
MIAVGNVVGSNICNIALVLGLSAVLRAIPCHPGLVARDLPLMLAVSLFLLLLSVDSYIARWEGAALFGGVVVYTCGNYWAAVHRTPAEPTPSGSPVASGRDLSRRWTQLAAIVAGIAGVVIGAELLVDAAVSIMHVFGVGEKFIGLTIVAFGTSLPEMATSVVAALRREMEISVGNLIGSNVFNILSVIGAAALVRPIILKGGIFASGLLIDYLVMMFVSAMPWLLARRRNHVSRCGGAMLLASYVVYVAYLVVEP